MPGFGHSQMQQAVGLVDAGGPCDHRVRLLLETVPSPFHSMARLLVAGSASHPGTTKAQPRITFVSSGARGHAPEAC